MGGLAELISATRHDRLVVVEKSLDELEDNPVNDYVMRKLGSINLAELSKNFGLQVTYPLAFIEDKLTIRTSNLLFFFPWNWQGPITDRTIETEEPDFHGQGKTPRGLQIAKTFTPGFFPKAIS